MASSLWGRLALRRRDRDSYEHLLRRLSAGSAYFGEGGMNRTVYPSGIGDYIIVHELLHFSVPNHGKLWKSLMRAYLGNYEKQEEALRKVADNMRLE